MGLFKKYADLSIDGVYQAYINADKIKCSNEAIGLKNELEHRKAFGEKPSTRCELLANDLDAAFKGQEKVSPEELLLVFSGTAHAYFRVWIVNLCLTLLTLGIFFAWAKVRRKRYFYAYTTIAGTPFQYLSQPILILKGRLMAAALSVAVAGLPMMLAQTKYSRQFETEADDFAFGLLKRKRYLPAAFAAIMEKLDEQRNDRPTGFGYFSTHPLTDERVQQARETADGKEEEY